MERVKAFVTSALGSTSRVVPVVSTSPVLWAHPIWPPRATEMRGIQVPTPMAPSAAPQICVRPDGVCAEMVTTFRHTQRAAAKVACCLASHASFWSHLVLLPWAYVHPICPPATTYTAVAA